MDKKRWKRHLKRKARQNQSSKAPFVAGTEVESLTVRGPLGEVECRRILLDARDPIPLLVPQLQESLLSEAPLRLIRTLCFRNWDDDPREVWQIPEAREICDRLWDEARPVLRLLTESTFDTPADERHGLEQHVLAALGLGWWEIYQYGRCRIASAKQQGDHWGLVVEGGGLTARREVKSQLFDISADNPVGYSFDAAADRKHFLEMNQEAVNAVASRLSSASRCETVVLVLSLLDEQAKKLAVAVAGHDAVRTRIELCAKADLHPGMVVPAPRDVTARYLDNFASDSASALRIMPNGHLPIVTIAHEGTLLTSVSVG